MARRAAILAAVGLVLGFASLPVARAAPPNTGTIYHSVTVQPDSIQTVTVTCPPGYFAVTGGMVVGKLLFTGGAGPLLGVTRSAPNAFTFRVGVPVTGAAQTIKLSVRCIRKGFKIPVKALNLKIGKATNGPVLVSPGSTTNGKVKCPAGQAPTGAGFDEQPADRPRRAETPRGGTLLHYPTGAAAHLTRSMPVNGGWEFTFHNSGNRPVDAVMEVDCVQSTYIGRLPDHRIAGRYETVFRQTSHNDLGGHSETTINARCTRGAPLGSGFAFSPALDLIPVTGPGRGRNQFVFDVLNGEMRLVPFVEYELCRDERSYIG
jgi:hypothetical protein